MKSRFKVLSLATAVLFATSCSKDDSSDSIVDAVQQQEEVVVKERSVTVTGKATTQSGLSKLAIDPGAEGHTVSFNDGDKIAFDNGTGIHGEGTIGENGKSFKLTIYYPATDGEEPELDAEGQPVLDANNNPVMKPKSTDLDYLDGKNVTLCIGNKPNGVAVKDNAKDCIYEEAEVTFVYNNEDKKLGDITANFEPMVAIIENASGKDCQIQVNGEETTHNFKIGQFAAVNYTVDEKNNPATTVTITETGNSSNTKQKTVDAKYYKFSTFSPAAK